MASFFYFRDIFNYFNGIEMLQLCLQLTEESKEVVKTEAEQLDRIEKKLDKLLSATNKIGA